MASHVSACSSPIANSALTAQASSSSMPRPTACASANQTSGLRPSSKRVSASNPSIAPDDNDTIGWTSVTKPRRWIIARTRARIVSR